MNRRHAAIFALYVLGVAVPVNVFSADSGEVSSGESQSQETSDAGRQTDDPRTVVAKWMDLVLADNVRESWELTTKSKGLNAQHDLPRLRNKHKVRIDRSLGNEAVAVVVTNTVTHVSSGVDRAFAFWLVQRDGSWLINMSYIDDPKSIEEQLRGFFMGGGVKWRVTNDDLVGTWLAGPGAPGGVGGSSCGSRFQLGDDGRFSLEMWGPGGPNDGIEVKRGAWRLEEDRIIREQDKQRLISRISWMGSDLLVLQPADQKWSNGKSGTHYRREKSDKT